MTLSNATWLVCTWHHSLIRDATHMWRASCIQKSHVLYMNESCLIYEWLMSHIWMTHAHQEASSQISNHYGVAMISRLFEIIGLFCRIWSLLQGSFAKETYNFKEPTNHSHLIFQCSDIKPLFQCSIGTPRIIDTHISTCTPPATLSASDWGTCAWHVWTCCQRHA